MASIVPDSIELCGVVEYLKIVSNKSWFGASWGNTIEPFSIYPTYASS
jgi:hypothetical protein